jgi:hypothetical protein
MKEIEREKRAMNNLNTFYVMLCIIYGTNRSTYLLQDQALISEGALVLSLLMG